MLNNNTRNKIMRKFDTLDKDRSYHNTGNDKAGNDIAGEVTYDTENKYTQHWMQIGHHNFLSVNVYNLFQLLEYLYYS